MKKQFFLFIIVAVFYTVSLVADTFSEFEAKITNISKFINSIELSTSAIINVKKNILSDPNDGTMSYGIYIVTTQTGEKILKKSIGELFH